MARKGGKDRGIVEKPAGSGHWWVRLVHQGREQWHKCDTKSQAKALYQRLRADIREEKFFPEKFTQKKDITLGAWIRRCLEGCSHRGLVNDRRYARRWSLWLGKKSLMALSIEDLRRHQVKMRSKMKFNTRTKQLQRQWADATINRHFAFLRHILMLALKDGKLTRNPVSAITFLSEERRTRFLTDEELRKLEAIMAPQDWTLVLFAIETGLRREEQFRLRWDQVDLENGVITIPLPKGGRTRHVPLSDTARSVLRSLDSFVRSPWVFPSKHPMKPQNPQSFVNNVYTVSLRKVGITGVNWHSLRHTAASRRVMAGVDLVSVKEILGHRDIATTMRYSHLSPNHLRNAVNQGSYPTSQLGTGSRTGSDALVFVPALPLVGPQVVDLMGETTWLGNQDPPLSSQFKNPKSKHAPIVRFLDKGYPHC
jgi:integrase